MEKDVFPKFDLFPRLTAIGRFVGRLGLQCSHDAPDYVSDHYRPAETPADTGAEHMLSLFEADLSGFGYQDGE